MMGMPRRKPKRAASSRDRPKSMPPLIVEPERESPGSAASPCRSPMTADLDEAKALGRLVRLHPAIGEFGDHEERGRAQKAERNGHHRRRERFDHAVQRQRRRPRWRPSPTPMSGHEPAVAWCAPDVAGSSEEGSRTMSAQKYVSIAISVAACRNTSNERLGRMPIRW